MPYTYNGRVRIYWEEEGQGDPLLLIMGLSFSLAIWGELRGILARHFRIILLDNRCVGKSDAPVRPFTVHTMAEDSVLVLDAAGVQKAHVFGMSMGGMIAQQLALDHPDRVGKLVLGCTHCDGKKAVWSESRFLRLLRFPFITKKARITRLLPYLYDPHTPHDRIQRDVELLNAHTPPLSASMRQMAAMTQWRCCDRLHEVKSPTLVIHGETDGLIPAESARFLASRIPGSKLVIIPNASHIFPTDQPEITQRELLGFLTEPGGALNEEVA